jgi:predicted nucleic-acid-binding Zn-ribbon protein
MADETPAGPQQHIREQAWIQTKWATGNCPYCEVNNWTVGAVLQLAAKPEGADSLMYTFKVFPVACNNCGNTVFVNAQISRQGGLA